MPPSHAGIIPDKVVLTALFLESIVFGIFLTLFTILIALSCAKDTIRLANPRFMFIVAAIMMAMSTTHLVISFVHVIKEFATGDPERPPDPISYLADSSNPLHVSKTLIYSLQALLGEAVLVWRCYIVCDRSFYVIIPTGIALLGNATLPIPLIVSFLKIAPGLSVLSVGGWEVKGIVTGFFIGLFLNLCCTVAIVGKLWRAHQRIPSNRGRSLFPVMTVIIESGALYTAGATSLIIAFLTRSGVQQVSLDIMTSLVGVMFCLIILQIRFQMRVLKPSSTGIISRSLQWRDSRRASTHELGDTAVHTTEHDNTGQE